MSEPVQRQSCALDQLPVALIVDDIPYHRTRLAEIVERGGLRCLPLDPSLCADPAGLLSQVKQRAEEVRASLVFLDMTFPDFRLDCQTIKAWLPSVSAQVFLYTTDEDNPEIREGRELGLRFVKKGDEDAIMEAVGRPRLEAPSGRGWIFKLKSTLLCARYWLLSELTHLQQHLRSSSGPLSERLRTLQAEFPVLAKVGFERPDASDLKAVECCRQSLSGSRDEVDNRLRHELANYMGTWRSVEQHLSIESLQGLADIGPALQSLVQRWALSDQNVRLLERCLVQSYPSAVSSTDRSEKTDILLIEDDELLALTIQGELESHGLKVQLARDAHEAREALAKAPPMAILDLALPSKFGHAPDIAEGMKLLEEFGIGVEMLVLTAFQDKPGIASAIFAERGVPASSFLFKNDPDHLARITRWATQRPDPEPLLTLAVREETGHLAHFNDIPVVLDRLAFGALITLSQQPGQNMSFPGETAACDRLERAVRTEFRRHGRHLDSSWITISPERSARLTRGVQVIEDDDAPPTDVVVIHLEDEEHWRQRMISLATRLSLPCISVAATWAANENLQTALRRGKDVLLILDLELGDEDTDGLSFFQQITDVHAGRVRAVIYSSHEEAESRRKAAGLGIGTFQYVPKSSSEEDLLAAIGHVLTEMRNRQRAPLPRTGHNLVLEPVSETMPKYLWVDGCFVPLSSMDWQYIWALAAQGHLGRLSQGDLSDVIEDRTGKAPTVNAVRSSIKRVNKQISRALELRGRKLRGNLVGGWTPLGRTHPVPEGYRIDCSFFIRPAAAHLPKMLQGWKHIRASRSVTDLGSEMQRAFSPSIEAECLGDTFNEVRCLLEKGDIEGIWERYLTPQNKSATGQDGRRLKADRGLRVFEVARELGLKNTRPLLDFLHGRNHPCSHASSLPPDLLELVRREFSPARGSMRSAVDG